jgi:hypothetical protein
VRPGPAAFALGALGCGRMALDGQVVDARGNPAAGARVTVVGTSCSGDVGEDGRFAVACEPGEHVVVITREGYTTVELKVEAGERKRYDLGKQVLVQIPTEKGLFVFSGAEYAPLKPGRLRRSMVDGPEGMTRAYCLDREQSEANTVAAGALTLFDNEAVGWRAFKLDAEGCAYRDQRQPTNQWKVLYKEKPASEEVEVGRGKRIARLQVEPGDYFLADWDKGFFTQAAAGEFSYVGSWVQVEG